MKKVKVPLAERSYEIQVGLGLIDRLGTACRRLKLGQRCAVIADKTVAGLYGKAAVGSLRKAGFNPVVLRVDPGEKSKSLRVVQDCYDALARERLSRDAFVVALGGGVVGDLAGFVASTYLRGVGFVQVPTSLLAQVDSSVGGKVGVNLRAGKNLVGSFYQPRLVLCDLETLHSSPTRIEGWPGRGDKVWDHCGFKIIYPIGKGPGQAVESGSGNPGFRGGTLLCHQG